MAETGVKLLGSRASPFVNRVQFALNLKTIDYEFLPEINWPVKSELLLKSNPVHKKIPVLIHDGKPVCESRLIIEYIDEAWPENGPSILPSDPHHRATVRFWAAYVDENLECFAVLRDLQGAKDEESKAAVLDKFMERLTLLEDAFVKMSNGKLYFGGDDLGFVDMVFGSHVGWLKVREVSANVKIFDETKTPALVKWVDRFVSHKSVQGALPEVDELLEVLKAHKARAYHGSAAEECRQRSDGRIDRGGRTGKSCP